jgi:YVTN family beta-propeller protein
MQSKWFAPSVNMNGSHNMWADKDGKFLYQTNWFSNKLTVFDRSTGAVLRNVEVGPSPSHVVTRPGSDTLIVPNNGGNKLVELDAGGNKVIKSYLTQKPGEAPALPHAHWVSYDGKYVVAPLSNETTASITNMDTNELIKPVSGGFPVATSMTNDGKRSYVANLLDHTITCLSNTAPACPTPTGDIVPSYKIDLRQNYDKITGKTSGPYGLSPIQLPISPDDSYMLVVGTFSANVLVIDMHTNKILKSLPCGPGCHGINFGLKKGGGWLGLVSIKFANKAMVVDGDPNGDGDASDAVVAGEMITNAGPNTKMDDTPTTNLGQGGNGVFAYPIPYNGWVQEMPDAWKSKMTCKQLAPLSTAVC